MFVPLPITLPAARKTGRSGDAGSAGDLDTGGYDVLIGGIGFRLASDTNFPYQRSTEQTTAHRFDNSQEPGEQSLSALPWIKSQSSFHGGAGQLNLEQGFTAFQYQQEQVEHIRFETSLGLDIWTPGQVTRLPDCHFSNFGFGAGTCITTAAVGGIDYAVIGGVNTLYQAKWASGPDGAITSTAIDLTGASFGGSSNCTILSVTTDGTNYYALVSLGTAVAGKTGYVITGAINSATAPVCLYDLTGTISGVVGWEKARLVAGLQNAFYVLSPTATAHSALPTAIYTHPVSSWSWSAVAASPGGILAAGSVGKKSEILQFVLDTSGAAPTLTGGASAWEPPQGEYITAMEDDAGSFLAVGTNLGCRIGTFDTYTGALKIGPISVDTTSPVLTLTNRDRFVYLGYSNQQADGKTGLARIDLSFVVDASGRNAFAPDLRPPTSAPTGLGSVTASCTLNQSNRIVFITAEGIHVEGSGSGSDGDAYLKTSRIRYDTVENKIFTRGRVRGTLDSAQIKVTAYAPFIDPVNAGTFGFLTDGDPGEFALPPDPTEWIQLQFDLLGSTCVFNGYQAKALPAPAVQELITFTVNCFTSEVDKSGLEVNDPQTPRARYTAALALKSAGNEVRFVEFTDTGSVAQLVVIDDLQFNSYSRPTLDDDFGGYITFRLRSAS